MLIIIVWAAGALMLLINIIMRTRMLRLEARIKALTDSEDYINYLRELAVDNKKMVAIRALRQRYPEVSNLQAVQLWQLIHNS